MGVKPQVRCQMKLSKVNKRIIFELMKFKAFGELDKLQPPANISYYDPRYLTHQAYEKLLCFEDENYFSCFSLNDTTATSIPKAPFGSFLLKRNILPTSFVSYEQQAIEMLKEEHIKKLLIVHPSEIYDQFIGIEMLKKSGYEIIYDDINQHIPLTDDWESTIHKMQARKLKNLRADGFEFKKMSTADLEKAHQFLTVCREMQGLKINISWEKLRKLNEEMPDTYTCFGVFRDGKMSAVCIAVQVNKETAYYYLPGTSPFFKSQSPMVLLIAGMVSFYKKLGFKYLDLGVSSLNGKPQETIRIFKKRMGAIETSKPTLIKHV